MTVYNCHLLDQWLWPFDDTLAFEVTVDGAMFGICSRERGWVKNWQKYHCHQLNHWLWSLNDFFLGISNHNQWCNLWFFLNRYPKSREISETPVKVYLLFQRRQFRDFCLNCLYWVFRWIFIPWNLEARIAPIGNFHQLVCCLWPFDDKLGISGLCYTFVMFQIILQVFLWLLNIQESEENLKSHLTLTNRSVFCSLQTALLPFIPAQAIQLCLDLNCLHWALKWLCSPRNPLVI